MSSEQVLQKYYALEAAINGKTLSEVATGKNSATN